MVDEEDSATPDWVINAVNPIVHRRPGGIWGEDVLPLVAWEASEHRVVLPTDLQEALGFSTGVLRWSSIKLRLILDRHGRDRHVAGDLTRYLENWVYVGEETGTYRGRFRVLTVDDLGRWYAITVGVDRNGSHNVITVFGGSDSGFLRNRLRHLMNIVQKEKYPSARAADLASLESAGAAGGEAVSRHEGYFHHQLYRLGQPPSGSRTWQR